MNTGRGLPVVHTEMQQSWLPIAITLYGKLSFDFAEAPLSATPAPVPLAAPSAEP